MKQCNLSSYTDDLQIFYAHSECTEVERAINSDLALVVKWYNLNGQKTIKNTKPLSGVKYKTNRLLGVKIPSFPQRLNWRCLVSISITSESLKITCLRFPEKCHTDSGTQAHEKMLPFEIRHDLYSSFIVPHFLPIVPECCIF